MKKSGIRETVNKRNRNLLNDSTFISDFSLILAHEGAEDIVSMNTPCL